MKLPKTVRDCIGELYAEYLEQRDREEGPRKIAWGMFVGSNSGSAPFWRHGFRRRFGHRLANGADHTIIPGYDVIAQAVAAEYPEWKDRCDELWEFLLSPYERRLTRMDFHEQAIVLVADSGTDDPPTVCDGDCEREETIRDPFLEYDVPRCTCDPRRARSAPGRRI